MPNSVWAPAVVVFGPEQSKTQKQRVLALLVNINQRTHKTVPQSPFFKAQEEVRFFLRLIHRYGVAAFNVFNYEAIAWAVEVAEEERLPILIQFYPRFEEFIPLSTVAAITKDLASRVKVPIGLHLDHCHSFQQALAGIRCDFPVSVIQLPQVLR